MADLKISKVQTSDGIVHDFSVAHTFVVPAGAIDKLDVTWNVESFSGSVALISGDDYLLTVPDAVSQ